MKQQTLRQKRNALVQKVTRVLKDAGFPKCHRFNMGFDHYRRPRWSWSPERGAGFVVVNEYGSIFVSAVEHDEFPGSWGMIQSQYYGKPYFYADHIRPVLEEYKAALDNKGIPCHIDGLRIHIEE